jgi:hypothetical protein
MSTTNETLELVASLMALQVQKADAMLTAHPDNFANGYRAAALDCLGIVNELASARKAGE